MPEHTEPLYPDADPIEPLEEIAKQLPLSAAAIAAATIQAAERIAVSIDRAAARRQAESSSAREIADELESLVSPGGPQAAAPSQVRATLYAAASLLRRL